MKKSKPKIRIGLLLHGNKIWISELLSILFNTVLLFSFTTLSLVILNNERKLHKISDDISTLKKENVVLKYTLEEIRERKRISQILCTFAGNKIKQHTIYQLTDLVYTGSKQFGYDPVLLLAVIKVESVFNSRALGRFRSGDLSGAMGLMQIKFATAQEVAKRLQFTLNSPEDLFKPEINIAIGVAYLTHLISRFQSFKLGLLAYNQGPQAIKMTLSKKEPLSMNYYKKVINSYFELQKLANRTAEQQDQQAGCR